MKHTDKPSQTDTSARLDALLSDFLNKDIVESAEPTRSTTTSIPLGDPLAGDWAAETKPLPDASATSGAQKVAPVNRTDVWEATSRPARSLKSAAVTNRGADQLEKDVDSIVAASTAAPGKRKLFFAILIGLLLLSGVLIWRNARTTVSLQTSEMSAVSVPPSEIDGLPAAEAGTSTPPEAHSGGPDAGPRDLPNSSHQNGNSSIAEQVPKASVHETPPAASVPSHATESNAASLQQMPVPSLGNSTMPLGTVQDLASVQPAAPLLPLPSGPPASAQKESLPETRATTATPAVPLTRVQPTYPEVARRMKVKGTVRVEIVVDKTGKVTSAKAVDGPQLLRAPAELAVKQWLFRPATMNGWRVESNGTVMILFNGERH